MSTSSLALDGAVSGLALRWGNGALRWGTGLVDSVDRSSDASVVPTGFPALDAVLGPGGLPRPLTATLKGDASSGKTTLALRLCAEAQARGAIVAYLDPGGTLDPVEAVARGVDLGWLVVLAPGHLDEGLAMAAALLQARAVDLLIVDLCGARLLRRSDGPLRGRGSERERAEAIRRLAALARGSRALLVVLEPVTLGGTLDGALAESSGLRLELARRAWIHLGREVVGQRVEVLVAKNRHGSPGRQVELEILYADGTDRDGCLARRDLLSQEGIRDASPPSRLATSPAPTGAGCLRLLPGRTGHPRRPAVGTGERPRRESRGTRLRCPARVAARRSA